jgi:Mrp family chromosome partitioning ATPase
MAMRRGKLKVLAEVARPLASGSRRGALRPSQLEAYDAVREDLGGARAVLITGDVACKGAAAVGIAAASAAAGVRTALVECDLAGPGLADALGLSPVPGLHEYLGWDAEASEILQPLVLAGPRSAGVKDPLVCVVAGEEADDAAALIDSESFGHAIAKMRAAYDLVILDGPPLVEDRLCALVAAQSETVVVCVKPSQANGKPGKELRRVVGRLPTSAAGLIVCGDP